ncbi:10757_t:CDS:10 [Acaulospora colombiana]|uniref:10757_t:CDS:1 n=1 Tax=Acaulospora colombiana TaxID=27376 RepID=A0ACA9KDE2_9GLOM|nr:10757_t:CDS:10 [Acaulospora colombiana]
MSKLAQLEKSQTSIFESVNEIEKTTTLLAEGMISLRNNFSETQGIAHHTLGQLFQLNEDLELYRSNSRKTYEDIIQQLKQSMEYNAHIVKNNIEILVHILKVRFDYSQILKGWNLQNIESNLLEMSTIQERVQDDMKEYKEKHHELADQWDQTLSEARRNFQLLLNLSHTEIRLLTQTVSDARESQKDIIRFLRPLAMIMDFVNLIYGSASYENIAKYLTPWLLVPILSVFALNLYANNNNVLLGLISTSGILVTTLIVIKRRRSKTGTATTTPQQCSSRESLSFHGSLTAAVDPAEPQKVLSILAQTGAKLTSILTTHHHPHHANGNIELVLAKPNLAVYGADARIPELNYVCKHNEEFTVGTLKVRSLHTPSHTKGSVCYYVRDGNEMNGEMEKAVFTGDTLLVGGCGRFTEGDAKDMYHVLYTVLGTLPKDTKVYCGHESASLNLQFASTVDPSNPSLHKKLAWAQNTHCTVPSTIEEELEYNPYLRVSDSSIQQATNVSDNFEVMTTLRALNDNFNAQNHRSSRRLNGYNGINGINGVNGLSRVNEMTGVNGMNGISTLM